jgi:hypothetical protein
VQKAVVVCRLHEPDPEGNMSSHGRE